MNMQTMLDRLQCDIRTKYGFAPQMRVSRVPLYEALWKELVVLIENVGDRKVIDIHIIGGDEAERLTHPSHDADVSLLMVWCARNAEACRLGYYVHVPKEMLDLVYAFWGTGNPGFLRAIRQVCLFTYKSKSNAITEKQTDMAIAGFIERNARCHQLSESHYRHKSAVNDWSGQTLRIARLLWRHVTTRWDYRDIKPSHGPGAVADAKRGYHKWEAIDRGGSRLCDKIYPVSEFFCPSPGTFVHAWASRDLIERDLGTWQDSVAKLAVVPKDKRGPRIICTQPAWAMWIQQGQRRNLEATIERSRLITTSRFKRGVSSSIKFDNQEQNGLLALLSSRTREHATIDLKDASDLVSWGLVRYLSNKEVSLALAASRTTHVRLPNNELVKLHMFAPMGSAMCFPVESLVFWAIATAAMHVRRGVEYEALCRDRAVAKTVLNSESQCFVFGDDVIIPREECEFVCERFRELGFVPNSGKTFAEGFYRESCGVDAYKGARLDICRLQAITVTSMSEAYATIDLARRCRQQELVELGNYLECQVESFLGIRIAAGCGNGPFWDREFPCSVWGQHMALWYNIRHRAKYRYNKRYQRYEGWTIIARPRREKAPQDGRYRLFRGLTSGVDEHTFVKKALEGGYDHELGWLSPDNLQYHPGWVAAF